MPGRTLQASAPSPAEEREPVELVFDSRDYPPRPSRPWFIPPPPVWTGSPEWGLDDPARLRTAPLRETASAALGFAYEGRLSAKRSTREIATLFGDWIETDLGRTEDLETALGLKRPGTSLTEIDSRSEIAVMAVRLARQSPWAGMTAIAAARAIKTAFDRWEAAVWPRYADCETAPPLAEPALIFWRMKAFGFVKTLPNEERLRSLIAADRGA